MIAVLLYSTTSQCRGFLVCEDISSLFQDACWVELGVWDELPGSRLLRPGVLSRHLCLVLTVYRRYRQPILLLSQTQMSLSC